MQIDLLSQLLSMTIPGDAESTVGGYLDLAHGGSSEAKARLGRCGIYVQGDRLYLNTSSAVLMRLLISPLLREKGAQFNIESGLLSLPIAVNPPVGEAIDVIAVDGEPTMLFADGHTEAI